MSIVTGRRRNATWKVGLNGDYGGNSVHLITISRFHSIGLTHDPNTVIARVSKHIGV